MNARAIGKRLSALEQIVRPSRGISILEIAASLWHKDRDQYIRMALRYPEARYWLPSFTDERVDWLALQGPLEEENEVQVASRSTEAPMEELRAALARLAAGQDPTPSQLTAAKEYLAGLGLE